MISSMWMAEPTTLTLSSTFTSWCSKADAAMALALEGILGDRLTEGVVNVKYGHVLPVKRVAPRSGHPCPMPPV